MGGIVLVTGAGGGLGQAYVKHLASTGVRVIAHDRELTPQLKQLSAETGAVPAVKDLTEPAACRELVQEVHTQHGRIDALVANHATMAMGLIHEADPEGWWRVVDTNLLGTYALLQQTVRVMRSQGGGGRIVVISSEWGVTGWPKASAYSASKAGLISLVKSLGRELAPEGILVNAVAPGVVDTPQLEVDAAAAGLSLAEMHSEYAEAIPMRRIGRPEEIAEVVSFLVDGSHAAMAGQTVQINGGTVRGRV